MFCECRQTSSGDLDCNYTTPFDARLSTTPKIESSTDATFFASTTTLIGTTIRHHSSTESEETSQTPTDLPSVYTSTITQSVPMTSFDGSLTSSTLEVLDLSSSTETSTFSITRDYSTKSSSSSSTSGSDTVESTSESTSMTATESSSESSSSLSSIFSSTRPTISRTTKLRPCPPDVTRSPRVTESTSERTESESTSTFQSELVTSSTQFMSSTVENGSGSTSSALTEEPSTTAASSFESSSSSPVQPSSTKSSTDELTTTQEQTSEASSESTSMSSTKSSEVEKPITTTTAPAATDATSPSTTIREEVSTAESSIGDATTIHTENSSTFKPPTTTEEIFTLTSTDVTKVIDTDCKTLKCYNGGTCVVTSEGPKCVCRFDRQDPNCRSLIRIKNAAFAGDSYLSHLIYSDSHKDFDLKPLDSVLPINIVLRARTRATDGLILLAIAQGTKGGHYTALFLHKGLLQFQFSCGLQTMLLSELEAPINTGHEFTIQVALDFSRNHSHCNASLRINDTLAMSGDQPTWLGLKTPGKSKTINSVWLHLGGSPQTPVVLMSELPGGQGFTGCLHNLRINESPKEIFRSDR